MSISLTLPNHAADPNEELIAFGDIHGHAQLLRKAFAEVSALPRSPGKKRKLVFLGDLIDRGPDSLGVIDLALSAERLVGVDDVIYLMGNHEMLLSYVLRSIPCSAPLMNPMLLSGEELHALTVWLSNGGDAVLGDRQIAELPGLIGEPRRAWLARLRPFYISGGIIFVHAGLPPHVPLPAILATPADTAIRGTVLRDHWAWIRETFLSHDPGRTGHHGYFVVHGHTIRDPLPDAKAQMGRSRLNLDGGSYETGIIRFARAHDNLIDLYEIAENRYD